MATGVPEFREVAWRACIYFRSLAQAKFKVIEEIEKDWDIKPFYSEWKHFKSQKRGAFFRISLTYLEPAQKP